MAGLYLLLNLCVATIPRCDNILAVLQHGLKQQLIDAPACHDQKISHKAAVQSAHLCECTLVKFVFITLPSFDHQRHIAFRIQTSELIRFDYTFGLASVSKGPEPPYPRWNLA